jgi:hypothetical protein
MGRQRRSRAVDAWAYRDPNGFAAGDLNLYRYCHNLLLLGAELWRCRLSSGVRPVARYGGERTGIATRFRLECKTWASDSHACFHQNADPQAEISHLR